MKVRDRIVELVRVPASELLPNPKNWRTHPTAQADALKGVLAEVGIADAVIARRLEDGQLMLIDGHLRTETLGDQLVPVLVLDVDESEGDKILATLDPLAALAEINAANLDALLRNVDTGNEALSQMLADLAGRSDEPDDSEKEIVSVDVRGPPEMAWVLIGVPVVKYGLIQEHFDRIAELDSITFLSTANDTRHEN